MWLRVLSECALEGSGAVRVNPRVISGEIGVRPRSVSGLLQELVSNKWIRIVSEPIRIERVDKNRESRGEELQPSLLPVLADGPHPLQEVWNLHRGKLPEAKSCKGARKKKADQRWREQTPDAWQETVKKMAESNFCNGKNDRGWRADFDFLLKPDTWAKANEGKYDNNKGSVSTAQTRKYDKLEELEKDWEQRGGSGG